jgi:hypothetical protein
VQHPRFITSGWDEAYLSSWHEDWKMVGRTEVPRHSREESSPCGRSRPETSLTSFPWKGAPSMWAAEQALVDKPVFPPALPMRPCKVHTNRKPGTEGALAQGPTASERLESPGSRWATTKFPSTLQHWVLKREAKVRTAAFPFLASSWPWLGQM